MCHFRTSSLRHSLKQLAESPSDIQGINLPFPVLVAVVRLIFPIWVFIIRCLALHQIGMLVYSELRSKSPSQSVLEGINILLASLRVSRHVMHVTFGFNCVGEHICVHVCVPLYVTLCRRGCIFVCVFV